MCGLGFLRDVECFDSGCLHARGQPLSKQIEVLSLLRSLRGPLRTPNPSLGPAPGAGARSRVINEALRPGAVHVLEE